MAETYTDKDILRLVEKAKKHADKKKDEPDTQDGNFSSDTTITPFVGKKNKKPVITRGFKLKHRKTGLSYTVTGVDFVNGDVVLFAQSGDGKTIDISSKEFKFYERL